MLPKTGNCAPFEQHSSHIPHASPSVVPPCSRQVPNLVPAQPSCNSPREGLLPSKETTEMTHCGRVRGLDEEASMHPHQRVASSAAGPSFLRPIGLKLKKSASLLEWLNKKLAEQGERHGGEFGRGNSQPPTLNCHGGAQNEVTLQADAHLSGARSSDTWQCLRAAASSCTSDEGVVWRGSFESNDSPMLDPLPYRESPDCLTASSGASMQASQSELDLEKFAASILLEDGPQLAQAGLGPARQSESSLQGSSSEWEAMLLDGSCMGTGHGACSAARPGTDADPGSQPGSATGSAVEAAARRHMQPGVSLTDEQAAFPPAHHFNPFRSLHADREGLLPETPIYGAESTAHHLQAASASPLQSGAAGSVFASEPSTPTGMPARAQRMVRAVSSSLPAGTAVKTSPSTAQRQRACRGSIDVLRNGSGGVSKLVASARSISLKEVPAGDLLCDAFVGEIH